MLGVSCGGSADGLETSRLICIAASVLQLTIKPPRTFFWRPVYVQPGQRSCKVPPRTLRFHCFQTWYK